MKKLFIGFGFAFIFCFSVFMVNQISLMSNAINQMTFLQLLTLLFYSTPSVIVMSLPFSVCLGFTHGLIKIGFFEMFKKNKKNILPVIISGLIILTVTYVVSDFVLPPATQNFKNLYRTILPNDEIVDMSNISLREMSSIDLVRNRADFMGSEKDRNLYLMELNMRFSLPFGALFFTAFAVALSITLKKRLKIAKFIAFVSCVIYWAMLIYGQIFSTRTNNFGVLTMWLPNVVFLFITIVLYYIWQKANRFSSAANAL